MSQPNLSDWLARKPAGKKPRVAVKKVSERRKREGREYTKLRNAFLNEHQFCEAGIPSQEYCGCVYVAKDVHHTKGRLNGNYLKESTWLAVCRPCHDWIHANGIQARKLNLLPTQ